jgi:hypothetical protein
MNCIPMSSEFCGRYVTKGIELLSQFKTGDIITSAKITEGAERLISPST